MGLPWHQCAAGLKAPALLGTVAEQHAADEGGIWRAHQHTRCASELFLFLAMNAGGFTRDLTGLLQTSAFQSVAHGLALLCMPGANLHLSM